MGFDESLGNGEPESGAAAGIELLETIKDRLTVLDGDAGTLVGHREDDRGTSKLRAHRNDALVGRMAQCVIEQVHEHLDDQETVNARWRQ